LAPVTGKTYDGANQTEAGFASVDAPGAGDGADIRYELAVDECANRPLRREEIAKELGAIF
jgi:hypothetical protein